MGAVKAGPLSFVMALLNLRLNYWLPNPEHVSVKPGFAASFRGQPGLRVSWGMSYDVLFIKGGY